MNAVLFESETQKITFSPVRFAKTATRLANEKNQALQAQVFALRLVVIALLAIIAGLI